MGKRARTYNSAGNGGRQRSVNSFSWYRISNAIGANGAAAEVAIYDEIGFWGVSASMFLEDLKAITADRILLRINSPGGEIFDGIAIFNVLRSMDAHITVQVDGIAASIASVIAMAGDTINMMPNSQMMIHNAQGVCMGEAADMIAMAELLQRQSANIADVYNTRAGGGAKGWLTRMAAETWMSAQEAVDLGLADAVVKVERQDPLPDNRWQDRLAAAFDTKRMAAKAAEPVEDDDTHEVTAADEETDDEKTCPDCGKVLPDAAALKEHQDGNCPAGNENAAEDFEVPDFAPTVLSAALLAATDRGFKWDPDAFRGTLETLAAEAQGVPARAPAEPETDDDLPDELEPADTAPTIGELVAILAAEAPAEPPRAPSLPVAVAEPAPVVVITEPSDPWAVVAEIMATAITMEANNRPAPPAREPEPEPEQGYDYDAYRMTRALKEAAR